MLCYNCEAQNEGECFDPAGKDHLVVNCTEEFPFSTSTFNLKRLPVPVNDAIEFNCFAAEALGEHTREFLLLKRIESQVRPLKVKQSGRIKALSHANVNRKSINFLQLSTTTIKDFDNRNLRTFV